MKLKLSAQLDIQILRIEEEVSLENLAVLRAGITKLLKSGKDKIILHFNEAPKLASNILTEVVKLQSLSAELGGSIVVVGQGEALRESISKLADPPALKLFISVEQAIASFQGAGPPSTAETEGLRKELQGLQEENQKLKEALEKVDQNKVENTQRENAQLQEHMRTMESQIKNLLKERKAPFDTQGLQTKIKELEISLQEALAGQVPKKQEGAPPTTGQPPTSGKAPATSPPPASAAGQVPKK